MKNKIDLETQFISKTAKKAIEKVGGSFKKVEIPKKSKAEK